MTSSDEPTSNNILHFEEDDNKNPNIPEELQKQTIKALQYACNKKVKAARRDLGIVGAMACFAFFVTAGMSLEKTANERKKHKAEVAKLNEELKNQKNLIEQAKKEDARDTEVIEDLRHSNIMLSNCDNKRTSFAKGVCLSRTIRKNRSHRARRR